jgi:hypothetical protein
MTDRSAAFDQPVLMGHYSGNGNRGGFQMRTLEEVSMEIQRERVAL